MSNTRISPFLRALVRIMAECDIPDPLAEEFTLAAIWYDLCALTGEDVPADVLALLDPLRPAREGVTA